MAIDLTPKDPLEPTRELPGTPFAELLTQMAEAIAEGQARLDLSSAEVLRALSETSVSIIPNIQQIIAEDGSVRFEQSEPMSVSLLDLGILPTFFAFSEASVEVVMDLKTVESITERGTSKKRTFLFAGTQSLRTERRLNRDVSVHSKLSVKLVPVPAPALLEPTRIVEDQGEGGGVP
ncbi:MAG: hypothetical protein IH858_06060 [Chloroflexi bacterium]|nr:hypothetical protein [Chloroflexota bacterium]